MVYPSSFKGPPGMSLGAVTHRAVEPSLDAMRKKIQNCPEIPIENHLQMTYQSKGKPKTTLF